MKRPHPYTPPPADVQELAEAAQYVGSPEHKRGGWWGGKGRPLGADGALAPRPKKQLTSICPLHTEEDHATATNWVRQAISKGCFRFVEGDKRFPKHIWHVGADGQGWQGRCINSVQGHYKGWPARPEDIAAEKRKKEASG